MRWKLKTLAMISCVYMAIASSEVSAACDESYQPTSKTSPVYPRRAVKRQIEGYVELEFTVTKAGKIENLAIVDAKPKRVFDRSAMRAAQHYEFEPCMENGDFVEITNYPVKFTFQLQ